MIVVPDASAVGAFILPDEDGAFARLSRETCRSNTLHVPPHWHAEIANLIWKARRRKRLNAEQFTVASRTATVLSNAVTVMADPPIAAIVDASATFQLSAYDACYFLLARRSGATLLTGDGPLRRAADAAGLPVIAP